MPIKGGAIASSLTTIIMSISSVTENTGSAIYITDGDSIEINNCTFFNNSTPENGGTIMCLVYCELKMVNTRFSQNRALQSGGVVFVNKDKRMSKAYCP